MELKEKIAHLKNKYKTTASRPFRKLIKILIITAIIGCVIGAVLWWDYKYNSTDSFATRLQGIVSYICLVLGGIALVSLLGIILVKLLLKIRRNFTTKYKENKKELRASKKLYRNMLKEKAKYLELLEDKIIEQIDEEIEKFEKEKNRLSTKSTSLAFKRLDVVRSINDQLIFIANLALKAKDTYLAISSNYYEFLDKRDWENLDLVIYFLETKRADSLKEALQLVDRKKDLEEIKGLIITASNSVKDTISNNTAKLAGFLGSCFNHLASQISSENKKIQIIIEKYNIKLSNLNPKPDYVHFLLTTQKTISLALIAKINTPSTKLMQDTNYMYNLAMQYEDK